MHSCSIRYFWESQNVSVCRLSLEAQLIRVSLFRHLNMPTSTKRKSDKDTSTGKTPANKPVFCLCWENEFKLQKCLSSEDAKLQFDLLSAVKATNCTIVSFATEAEFYEKETEFKIDSLIHENRKLENTIQQLETNANASPPSKRSKTAASSLLQAVNHSSESSPPKKVSAVNQETMSNVPTWDAVDRSRDVASKAVLTLPTSGS